MELTLHRPSETARGSKFLEADSNENSLSELLEAEPMESANWIDFGEANEFHESMRHAEQIREQHDDDDSTIPVGSEVDLGAPLTDLEDFSGSQNLDSELIDDLSALERMKELLGQEVSRRSTKYLSRRPKLSSLASSNSDEDNDADSIQLELLSGRSTSSRSKIHYSKGSNMTVSTAPMYGEKPRKSKKTSTDGQMTKKTRRSRSQDGDHSDSGDDVCLTFQPLGESDDPNPVALLDDDNEDPLIRPLQKAV